MSLKTLVTDTYDTLNWVNSINGIVSDHFHLLKVGMAPSHFCI